MDQAIPKTLMLEARTEALRMNLENIETHLKKARNPREELGKRMEEFREIHRLLRAPTIAASKAVITLVGDMTEEDKKELQQELKEAGDVQEKLRARLKGACDGIEKLIGEYTRVQDTDAVKKGIANTLTTRTDSQIDSLARLPVEPQTRWTSLLKTTEDATDTIFSQYIELLGGLAVRDIGFDAGTSKLADELLTACGTTKKGLPMLAIPTRKKAKAITLGRVVRVTFPDWTIWALPATAFEFWHVVAQEELEEALQMDLQMVTGNNAATVDARFQNCLGDVFATYTMGPAYAYFAILLLLNPAAPYTGTDKSVADDVRVASIIETLTWMDEKRRAGGENPLFVKVQTELVQAWKDAVSQACVDPASEEEKVKRAVEMNQVNLDMPVMKQHVEALWRTLSANPSSPFSERIWEDINGWVKPLLEKKVDSIQIPQSPELRHVLNAAWLARMEPNRKRQMNLQDLTEAAQDLAKKASKLMKGP